MKVAHIWLIVVLCFVLGCAPVVWDRGDPRSGANSPEIEGVVRRTDVFRDAGTLGTTLREQAAGASRILYFRSVSLTRGFENGKFGKDFLESLEAGRVSRDTAFFVLFERKDGLTLVSNYFAPHIGAFKPIETFAVTNGFYVCHAGRPSEVLKEFERICNELIHAKEAIRPGRNSFDGSRIDIIQLRDSSAAYEWVFVNPVRGDRKDFPEVMRRTELVDEAFDVFWKNFM